MPKDRIAEHKTVLKAMIRQAEESLGISAAFGYSSKLLAALEEIERMDRE